MCISCRLRLKSLSFPIFPSPAPLSLSLSMTLFLLVAADSFDMFGAQIVLPNGFGEEPKLSRHALGTRKVRRAEG